MVVYKPFFLKTAATDQKNTAVLDLFGVGIGIAGIAMYKYHHLGDQIIYSNNIFSTADCAFNSSAALFDIITGI